MKLIFILFLSSYWVQSYCLLLKVFFISKKIVTAPIQRCINWGIRFLPKPQLQTNFEPWPSFRNRTLIQIRQGLQNPETGESNDTEQIVMKRVLLAKLLSWLLQKLIRKHTDYVQNLQVYVHALSNPHVIRGKIDQIHLNFNKISFRGLYVSGGGKLMLKDIDLRMRRFLFQNLQTLRKPYVIHADFTFTQQDIINSKLFRDLIQLLVNLILEKIFAANRIVSASIRKVTINTCRIATQGTVKLQLTQHSLFPMSSSLSPSSSTTVTTEGSNTSISKSRNEDFQASVDFEISAETAMRDEGQIFCLKDLQVILNPDSMLLRTSVSLPIVSSSIDVDIGDDCRIESLVIANKCIRIRAISLISPISPFAVTTSVSKAMFKYDLSSFFSSLLWLNGGILMKLLPSPSS
jgi:hypothetical protein